MTEEEFRNGFTAKEQKAMRGLPLISEKVVPKYEVEADGWITIPSRRASPALDIQGGTKFDDGKARYDLIPPEALQALAELYGMGARKYGDRNWEKGMSWGRIFAAGMRHAWSWFRGEDRDPVDGQHHMIALAWAGFALYMYQLRNVGTDDRKLIT